MNRITVFVILLSFSFWIFPMGCQKECTRCELTRTPTDKTVIEVCEENYREISQGIVTITQYGPGAGTFASQTAALDSLKKSNFQCK